MLLNLAIPEKVQTGGVEDIFSWKGLLEFLDLSLFPWKFQANWSFTPGNSTKSCYTHWNFQGQKPRPMEIPHYFFSWSRLEIPLLFYWPLEFPHSTFSILLEILCPKRSSSPFFTAAFWIAKNCFCIDSKGHLNKWICILQGYYMQQVVQL